MINIINTCIELSEAIKADNPQPIISFIKRTNPMGAPNFTTDINPIHTIISEIIEQDKTELMEAILSSGENLFAFGAFQNDTTLSPIINAIIKHEHTETICCIIKDYNFRMRYNTNSCLAAAALSENIPIIQFIKDLPEEKVKFSSPPLPFSMLKTSLKTTVDNEITQNLIDTERYDLLDILTDNGKLLKKFEVCENILLSAERNNEKRYLSALAKRYMPDYAKSRNKTKALKSFLEKNADLTIVADSIFQFPCPPFCFDINQLLAHFKFLSQLGVKTNNTNIVFSYALATAKESFCSDDEAEQLITYLTTFVDENAEYNLSNVLCTMGTACENTKSVFELFFKDAKKKPVLLVDTLRYIFNISYENIETLMNFFDFRITGKVEENDAITVLIEINNLQIMKMLTEAGLFTFDDVKKLSKLCTKMNKTRMAEDIKKWYKSSQHN